MSTTQAIIAEGLQVIPLASINPNPDNPRKHRDAAALQELADSIKAQGVWEPIVVRPDPIKPKTYELVMGERRWRASKLAGKTDIPAIVRDLTDRQALEAMILENLQREDVQPIDEARGYRLLLDSGSDNGSPAHTVDSLASKIGKSPSYVHARLKLLVLIPAAAEALSQGRISAGHAVLIARLQPSDQVAALFACFSYRHDPREIKKYDFASVKFSDLIEDDQAHLSPEKALREWIQDNINLKLKGVPWELEDAQLVPEAGACSACLKRSTSNPMLFQELAIKGEDTCFDAACFQMKRSAFVKITLKNSRAEAQEKNAAAPETSGESGEPRAQAQPMLQLSELHAYTKAKPDQAVYRAGQWIPAKSGSCPNVRKGILVRGEEAGQTKLVCVDDKCKVHKHDLSSASAAQRSGDDDYDDYEQQEFTRHRQEIRDQKRTRGRIVLAQHIVSHTGNKLSEELIREAIRNRMGNASEAGTISWLLGEKKALSPKELNAAVDKSKGRRLYQIFAAFTLLDERLSTYANKAQDEEDRAALIAIAKDAGLKNAGALLVEADKKIAAANACRACGCTEEIPCRYWDGGKHVSCSWEEDDLCSNPKCVRYEAKRKGVSSKNSGGGTKPSRVAG